MTPRVSTSRALPVKRGWVRHRCPSSRLSPSPTPRWRPRPFSTSERNTTRASWHALTLMPRKRCSENKRADGAVQGGLVDRIQQGALVHYQTQRSFSP